MTIALLRRFIAVQWLEWPGLGGVPRLAGVATLAASYALETHRLRGRCASGGASMMFVFIFTFIVSEFVAYRGDARSSARGRRRSFRRSSGR